MTVVRASAAIPISRAEGLDFGIACEGPPQNTGGLTVLWATVHGGGAIRRGPTPASCATAQ
jgi:hypothetical protein